MSGGVQFRCRPNLLATVDILLALRVVTIIVIHLTSSTAMGSGGGGGDDPAVLLLGCILEGINAGAWAIFLIRLIMRLLMQRQVISMDCLNISRPYRFFVLWPALQSLVLAAQQSWSSWQWQFQCCENDHRNSWGLLGGVLDSILQEILRSGARILRRENNHEASRRVAEPRNPGRSWGADVELTAPSRMSLDRGETQEASKTIVHRGRQKNQ